MQDKSMMPSSLEPFSQDKSPQEKTSTVLDIVLRDEEATRDLAKLLAPCLQRGDIIMLSGDLGAGKSAFARALIRNLCQNPALDVPSPSFSLMQHYEGIDFPIIHADLYRLQSPDDIAGLGLEELMQEGVCVVEWPEHGILPSSTSADTRSILRFCQRICHITLSYGANGLSNLRHARIALSGSLQEEFYQALAVQQFLEAANWGHVERTVLQGDASTKIYERLVRTGKDGKALTASPKDAKPVTAILAIVPERVQPPLPGRSLSYADVAHLSTRLAPALLVAQTLRAIGLSAPQIYAHDGKAGFALWEDLGAQMIAEQNAPVHERYHMAIAVLAHLHSYTMPQELSAPEVGSHTLAFYDREALLIELEQFVEWYVPYSARLTLSARAREEFLMQWRVVIDAHILDAPPVWTLRDYHSPNLFWLPAREGLAKIGLIDLQDTVLGHAAYDVASLCQDARVSVDEGLELELLGTYVKARYAQDENFDVQEFAKAYRVLGAQRALKILGVFVRLDKRDGKPQYLAHLERVKHYLLRNLRHPALAPVKAWFESVPGIFG